VDGQKEILVDVCASLLIPPLNFVYCPLLGVEILEEWMERRHVFVTRDERITAMFILGRKKKYNYYFDFPNVLWTVRIK
jgi:hypothetical protein